jgi:hypothetical protein
MIAEPSTNGTNGRDAGGRFAAGNREGKGNPHARAVARLRAAMLDAVTDDDVSAIVKALVAKAKAGDLRAAQEVLDRCLGRVQHELPLNTLDVYAWQAGDEPTALASILAGALHRT